MNHSMNLIITYATLADVDWLYNEAWRSARIAGIEYMKRKVKNNQIAIARISNERKGFVAFEYDSWQAGVPEMNYVWVNTVNRGKGIGTSLSKFWEDEMRKGGYMIVSTSVMEEEITAQKWHQQNGYVRSEEIEFQGHVKIYFTKQLPMSE